MKKKLITEIGIILIIFIVTVSATIILNNIFALPYIAVVNLDEPVDKMDFTYGEVLIDKLDEKKYSNIDYTNYQEAYIGLEDNEYAAYVIIEPNFTGNIVNNKGKYNVDDTIIYRTDSKLSELTTTMDQKVTKQKEYINEKINNIFFYTKVTSFSNDNIPYEEVMKDKKSIIQINQELNKIKQLQNITMHTKFDENIKDTAKEVKRITTCKNIEKGCVYYNPQELKPLFEEAISGDLDPIMDYLTENLKNQEGIDEIEYLPGATRVVSNVLFVMNANILVEEFENDEQKHKAYAGLKKVEELQNIVDIITKEGDGYDVEDITFNQDKHTLQVKAGPYNSEPHNTKIIDKKEDKKEGTVAKDRLAYAIGFDENALGTTFLNFKPIMVVSRFTEIGGVLFTSNEFNENELLEQWLETTGTFTKDGQTITDKTNEEMLEVLAKEVEVEFVT